MSLNTAINNLLRDISAGRNYTTTMLEAESTSFLTAIRDSRTFEHWTGLIEKQISELNNLFETDALMHSNRSPEVQTPAGQSGSSSGPDLSHIKVFSPLIDESSRLKCSIVGCNSRFSYRRSYESHMRNFHPNMEVRKVRDPPGTCRLFVANSQRPCNAKLPVRSIYYHLLHLHQVHRPSPEEILIGFDLTSTPRAVFGKKKDLEQHLRNSSEDAMRQTRNEVSSLRGDVAGPSSAPAAGPSSGPVNQHRSAPVAGPTLAAIAGPSSGPVPRRKSAPRATIRSTHVAGPTSSPAAINISSPVYQRRSAPVAGPILAAIAGPSSGPVPRRQSDPRARIRSIPVGGPTSSPAATNISSPASGSTSILTPRSSRSKHTALRKRKLDLPSASSSSISISSDEEMDNFRKEYEDCVPKKVPGKSPEEPKLLSNSPEEENLDNKSSNSSSQKDYEKEKKLKQVDDSESDMETTSSSENEEEELSSYYTDDNEIDSDHEIGDIETENEIRIRNKKIRHMNRNTNLVPLHQKPGNLAFIQDMTTYMKKATIDTTNPTTSTITRTVRHLFTDDDSFLSFQVNKNITFCCENLRSFKSENFEHLQFPMDWLVSTCLRDGIKGLERLKSHACLRKFLEYEVDKMDSSKDFQLMKDTVRVNLQEITKQITNNKLFKKYTTLSKQNKQKKDKALMILEPGRQINIENLVRTWNQSFEKTETDRDYQFILETSIENNHISIRNLTAYSSYARICLLLRKVGSFIVYSQTLWLLIGEYFWILTFSS